MNIGQRIRELREKSGLTQEQLASQIKTTKQTIYKYEQGIITNIPSDRLESIAGVFGVKPTYLVGWEDAEPAPVEESYTEEELELIRVYRSLNEEGRSFVEQVKKLLRSSPQYYKEDEEKEKTEG